LIYPPGYGSKRTLTGSPNKASPRPEKAAISRPLRFAALRHAAVIASVPDASAVALVADERSVKVDHSRPGEATPESAVRLKYETETHSSRTSLIAHAFPA
jgi:hypothetical protein